MWEIESPIQGDLEKTEWLKTHSPLLPNEAKIYNGIMRVHPYTWQSSR
jgi:hypothetical protein